MEGHIITIVEGIVPEDNWKAVTEGYSTITTSVPEGIIESFITQERNQPELWRLVTLWGSLDRLKEMQKNNSVPSGVKIFKDVGVEPQVKIFDVRGSFNL